MADHVKLSNLLVVEEVAQSSSGEITFRCFCIICERFCEKTELALKKANHCGCEKKHRPHFKDCGSMRYSHLKAIKYSANYGSRRKDRFKIPVKVDCSYLWDLYLHQEGKCNCCDDKIFFDNETVSLDRIKNWEGYIPGNVQWLCKECNRMKKDRDKKEYEDHILKMAGAIRKKRRI